MPNAADRKSIRRQEKDARIAERQRADVVRMVMSSPQGRAWLWDILSSTAMFHTTFNGDALQSAFQEGRRSVGLALLADVMAHCPDQYILAMREANERRITDAIRDTADPDPDAERRGSPQPDGGDSGTVADRGAAEANTDPNFADDGRWIGQGPDPRSPGADIYVQA